jgi:hypothetical protein
MQSDEYTKNLDNFSTFWARFAKVFKKYHQEDDALFYLKSKHQGPKETAQTFITNWKQLAALAEFQIENNDRIALDYLKPLINDNLRRKMAGLLNEPEKFEDWTESAILFDNKWRRESDQRMGLSRPFTAQGFRSNQPFRPAKDPYAMDVDAMNIDDQTGRRDYMNKQVCYNCGHNGHFIRECKMPLRPRNETQRWTPSYASSSKPATNTRAIAGVPTKKLATHDAAQHIRSLLAQYTGDEENKIFTQFRNMQLDPDFQ